MLKVILRTSLTAIAGSLVGVVGFAAWSGHQAGRAKYELEQSAECLLVAAKALVAADRTIKALDADLHHDYGAGTALLATTPIKEEAWALHEYVISIIEEEDPEHARLWSVETVDLGKPTYEPVRRYSVIVAELSMPAFGSLCDVLNQSWGWREFYRHPEKPHPEKVQKAIMYPGRTDLLCVMANYTTLRIPQENWQERRWAEWEHEMVQNPSDFEAYERNMEIDWLESPWHKRPHPRQFVFLD